MIYLLADDFFGPERLAELKRNFPQPELLELNTTNLDGARLTVRELAEACEAMPFLAAKRLVIVHKLASRFDSKRQAGDDGHEQSGRGAKRKSEAQQFCDYLAKVPPSTELALLEPGPLNQHNPFLKALAQVGGEVVSGRILKSAQLEDWIAERVRKHGGRIASAAITQLAAIGGTNLRALDNEIEKLVTYAGGEVITESEIGLLVSSAREISVFAMVDAVGSRRPKAALSLLHGLLSEGEPPLLLLAMIIRQFRLLIQISELRNAGLGQQRVAAELRQKPFVVARLWDQASKFSPRQLEVAYQRLVEADLANKTGRSEATIELELLTIELISVPR